MLAPLAKKGDNVMIHSLIFGGIILGKIDYGLT